MNLEGLAVVLRQRAEWETFDFGIDLVRHWWRPVFTAWLVVTVPVVLLLVLGLDGFGLLVFWWLLPLFETAVLYSLSRAVFGQVPTWQEAVRAMPKLWRDAWRELLLRRFVPARVQRLAVRQLEGLQGKARSQRVEVLFRGRGGGQWLPVLFLLFEAVVFTSMLFLAVLMTPTWTGVDWTQITDDWLDGTLGQPLLIVLQLTLAATLLLLHPFYVGAGFATYLDRRTELEGWDLEIAFRAIDRRLSVGSRRVAVLCVLLLGYGALAPQPVSAREQATQPTPHHEQEAAAAQAPSERSGAVWSGAPERDPRRVAAEILEGSDFERQVTQTRWQLRDDLFPDVKVSGPSWVPNLFQGVATSLETFLWLVGGAMVLGIFWTVWKSQRDLRPLAEDTPEPPQRLFGLDIRRESLPADIPAAAETLWRAGKPAEALSLLYRGALGRLVTEGVELRESFTEDDCLRAARPSLAPGRSTFFGELTRAWQSVAYAHRVPREDRAELLWSSWAEHFGRSR